MTCPSCLSGDHNLCATSQPTIAGHHGGFADKVRARCASVVNLPRGIDLESTGPLFCGGVTVFNPLVQFDIKPTAKVGVIGIGGLGHLALQFSNAWGCEVTAFTSLVGGASPMDFNGMVRHYYLRKGPNVADLRVNLLHRNHRAMDSHALGLRIRNDLDAIAHEHGANLKLVEVPPGPPVMSPLVAEVYGPDRPTQRAIAERVLEVFDGTDACVPRNRVSA